MSSASDPRPPRAGIALGSNLGDRLENLRRARDEICALPGTEQPILQSAVYETAPVECEAGASNFYNAVLEIGFADCAQELLKSCQMIEVSLGRRPDHGRNVSRSIDLDLLYLGGEVEAVPGLRLPHPRMKAREFVLRPLAEIAPDLRLPGETASVRELLARLNSKEAIERVIEKW